MLMIERALAIHTSSGGSSQATIQIPSSFAVDGQQITIDGQQIAVDGGHLNITVEHVSGQCVCVCVWVGSSQHHCGTCVWSVCVCVGGGSPQHHCETCVWSVCVCVGGGVISTSLEHVSGQCVCVGVIST